MRGGCNIQNMPFKDNNSVDILVCTETLEHVPDMQRAINECYHILKVSGYIFSICIAHFKQSSLTSNFLSSS